MIPDDQLPEPPELEEGQDDDPGLPTLKPLPELPNSLSPSWPEELTAHAPQEQEPVLPDAWRDQPRPMGAVGRQSPVIGPGVERQDDADLHGILQAIEARLGVIEEMLRSSAGYMI